MGLRAAMGLHMLLGAAGEGLGAAAAGGAAGEQPAVSPAPVPALPPTDPSISVALAGLGVVHGVRTGDKHVAFKGIPYAEPPIAALRWQPPVSKKPWVSTKPTICSMKSIIFVPFSIIFVPFSTKSGLCLSVLLRRAAFAKLLASGTFARRAQVNSTQKSKDSFNRK